MKLRKKSGVDEEIDLEIQQAQLGLTKQELIFAEAMLRGDSREEAVKKYGYTGKHVRVYASRLLRKPAIRDYLQFNSEIEKELRRREIEVDDLWLTEQFKLVYERCMQAIPVMRYDREAGAMVQETDANGEGVWTFDSNGALRALENISRNTGFYELDNKQRRAIIQVAIVQMQGQSSEEGEEEEIEEGDNISGYIQQEGDGTAVD